MHGYKACTNVHLSKCALYVFKLNWIHLFEGLYQQVLGRHIVQCSTTLFGHKEGIKSTKL